MSDVSSIGIVYVVMHEFRQIASRQTSCGIAIMIRTNFSSNIGCLMSGGSEIDYYTKHVGSNPSKPEIDNIGCCISHYKWFTYLLSETCRRDVNLESHVTTPSGQSATTYNRNVRVKVKDTGSSTRPPRWSDDDVYDDLESSGIELAPSGLMMISRTSRNNSTPSPPSLHTGLTAERHVMPVTSPGDVIKLAFSASSRNNILNLFITTIVLLAIFVIR